MKKTLTLPESDILALDTAAKKYGTVELAIAIGISKTQLYEIIKGRNNKVTEESARKIKDWLDMDANESDKKTAVKSLKKDTQAMREHLTKKTHGFFAVNPEKALKSEKSKKGETHNPRVYPLKSDKSVSAWDSPEFLRIAVVKVAEAISQGRLKNVRIAIDGGLIPCGD